MTETVKTDQSKVCFTERSRIILNWLFPKKRIQYRHFEKPEIEEPIKNPQYFNFRKLQTLMEYVLEENERLGLVMAEYYHIDCRGRFEPEGFMGWTRPASFIEETESLSPNEYWKANGPKMGALLDLLSFNSQAPRHINPIFIKNGIPFGCL